MASGFVMDIKWQILFVVRWIQWPVSWGPTSIAKFIWTPGNENRMFEVTYLMGIIFTLETNYYFCFTSDAIKTYYAGMIPVVLWRYAKKWCLIVPIQGINTQIARYQIPMY